MANDRKVIGKKYRILSNAVTKAWDVISFWTSSKDVEMADGTNLEDAYQDMKVQVDESAGITNGLQAKILNAPVYSAELKYSKGDIVSYNGAIYICIVDITNPEPWNPSHWRLVKDTDTIPFQFGIDGDGNYGYIKVGADTVTPFKQAISKKIYLGEGSNGYITSAVIQKACNDNHISMKQITIDNFVFEVSGVDCIYTESDKHRIGLVNAYSPSRSYVDGTLNYNNGGYVMNTGAVAWINGGASGMTTTFNVPDTPPNQWYRYWYNNGESRDFNEVFSGRCLVSPITKIYLIY